jgi:hypothetical protein
VTDFEGLSTAEGVTIPPGTFRPLATVGKRVLQRLTESGQAVIDLPGAIGRGVTGRGTMEDLFTGLRAVASPFEPIFAPIGESLRTSAEEFGATPGAAQLIGAGGEIATGLALPFIRTAPTPALGRPLQRVGIGRAPEATLEAERALELGRQATAVARKAGPPRVLVDDLGLVPGAEPAPAPTRPPTEPLPTGVSEADVFDRIQAIRKTTEDIRTSIQPGKTVIFDPESLAQGRKRPIGAVYGGKTLDLVADTFDEVNAVKDVPPGKLIEAIKKDKENPIYQRLKDAVRDQIAKEQVEGPQLGLLPEGVVETPPPFAGNINLGRIQTPDDVKNLITDVARANRGVIEEARRGVITHEETARLADTIGLTADKLLKRQRGKAFNAEEALAARQILTQSAEDTYELARLARTGDEGGKVEFLLGLQRHIALQKQVSGLTAEAGRTLSAMRIAGESAPARARAFKRVVEAIGGEEKLTEEIIDRLAKIDPESPTFIRDVNIFIRDVSEAKTSDKVFEVWVNALLSGPQTHVVNTVSNALTALSRPLLERPTAATLDFFRATFTGTERQRFFRETAADLFGMTQGLREGVRRGLEAYQTELAAFGRTKLEIAPAARQAIKGETGRAVRVPSRALIAADEFFKSVNFQGELHALAFRQAVQEGRRGGARAARIAEILRNPSGELLEKATGEALYRTFQAELGPAGQQLQSFRNSVNGARYITPFIRTPVNITKFGLERTPLNFLRLAVKAKRGELQGVALADELAKPVMGSLIGAAVAWGVSGGLISGGGPRDPSRRQALRATGWQPYSVKVGDQWVSYGRLEPLGIVLGLTSDYVELFDTLEHEDAVGKISLAIAQNLTNKTFLRGLSDAINAASDPERFGERWVRGLTGTAVPTGIAQLARGIDPTMRRPETALQGLQARVPFLSSQVPPIRDIWGQPVLLPETGPERFLSPIRRSPVIQDKASQEIVRLDVRPGSPRRQLGRIELSSGEYERYSELAGTLARRMVKGFVESPGYDRLPDLIKAQKLEDLFNKARAAARVAAKGEALPRILREQGQGGLLRAVSPLGELMAPQEGR